MIVSKCFHFLKRTASSGYFSFFFITYLEFPLSKFSTVLQKEMDNHFFLRLYHGAKLRFNVSGYFKLVPGNSFGNVPNSSQLNYGGQNRPFWEVTLKAREIARKQAGAGCSD